MPRHAASSKGLRGSSVRREAGDGAPVDVRGVMPLTVAALAVSTCSRACAISPSARSSARSAASSAEAALRRRTEASRRQLREKSSSAFADGGVSARRDDERPRASPELGRKGLVAQGGVETESALRRRRRPPPELFLRDGGGCWAKGGGVADSRVGGITTIASDGAPRNVQGLTQSVSLLT